MIEIINASGKGISNAIKLINVHSIDEGWQFIDEYAKNSCQYRGYDEYGIEEFYEDKAYATVVFLLDNEVHESLCFDISEFEKYQNFGTYRPYLNFVFSNPREMNKQNNLLRQVIKDHPLVKINNADGRTKETAIKITEAKDHRVGWEFLYDFMDKYKA